MISLLCDFHMYLGLFFFCRPCLRPRQLTVRFQLLLYVLLFLVLAFEFTVNGVSLMEALDYFQFVLKQDGESLHVSMCVSFLNTSVSRFPSSPRADPKQNVLIFERCENSVCVNMIV